MSDITRFCDCLPSHVTFDDTLEDQAILFSGPGGNGKGALLAAIRTFLGERNVSSLNLDQIASERFSVVNLYSKLANLCVNHRP